MVEGIGNTINNWVCWNGMVDLLIIKLNIMMRIKDGGFESL